MTDYDLVIRNARVVTEDRQLDGDIAVKDGCVVALEPGIAGKGAREIDAGGNVTTLGSGQFSFPWAVTVDASGDVFVLDLGDGFVHEIIP